jgi:hypothetical protein
MFEVRRCDGCRLRRSAAVDPHPSQLIWLLARLAGAKCGDKSFNVLGSPANDALTQYQGFWEPVGVTQIVKGSLADAEQACRFFACQ